ncbi:MAG: isocitrate/isopropylmalate family dehydrogenase, partial [Bernardetiaceae bacterium]|nr:isocitrate/isopropylmalate family dehydrogenase [Bernardetiaceae bacterium]
LLGAVLMLNHIGQADVATKVHNAWLRTLEDGIHTYDIFKEGVSQEKVGTKEFAQAVIARLGQKPNQLKAVDYGTSKPKEFKPFQFRPHTPAKKDTVGVDVFINWEGQPNAIGKIMEGCSTDRLKLVVISNRGVKVYPDGLPETFCTDHWRCRFESPDGGPIGHADILAVLANTAKAGIDFIKTENLCHFDGKKGYTLAQGQ